MEINFSNKYSLTYLLKVLKFMMFFSDLSKEFQILVVL